ncbi:MAG: protein kinase [Acidobacteriota bacterium]|nr:protein kinase [Acidobacteriota bacterium]
MRSSALLLRPGETVHSGDSGRRYTIGRLVGQGGFGQVYLAQPVHRSDDLPSDVCVKVSLGIETWVREAYFGQLLHGHPRAIQVFDRFPVMREGGSTLYCLVLEYASFGDLSSHLARTGQAWPEVRARRQMVGVLEVLGKLHRGQLLHRDLTPMNVFVCEGLTLKLGDFGIVRQQSDRRGITARTMNTLTAPSDIIDGRVPKWRARDDVYQVGQLLAMLIRGDAGTRIQPAAVRALACSNHLKEIIYRCIGERRKRYDNAVELIDALRARPAALDVGRVRSLKGVHLAFTGVLARPRAEAAKAARRVGAIVHGSPTSLTSVVVRGAPNPRQAAGADGGRKLLELKRLREKGQQVVVLDERQFWRLVTKRRA